jgi:hypothetical protein
MDRLLATFQINDRQPAHGKSDAIVKIEAVFVRPSMADRLAHSAEQRLVYLPVTRANYSYDSTHNIFLFRLCRTARRFQK